MKSNLNLVRLVCYSDIFGAESSKQLDEYLKGMGKEFIVKACAHFVTFKYGDPIHNKYPELIGMFLGPSNKELAKKVGPKYADFAKDKEVRLLNNLAFLEILEFALKEVDETVLFNEQEIEENFLKALLFVNEGILFRQERILETVEGVEGFSKAARLTLTNLIAYADIDNLNLKELLNSQVIRIIKLFQFIVNDSKLTPIYDEFLNQYGVTSWQEYLKLYLTIPFKIVVNSKKGRSEFDISQEEDKVRIAQLLDQLCVDEHDQFPQDFLQVRNNPLYKVTDEVYMVLYKVFAIERVFKSVYFKLNAINEALPEELKVKNFKSDYCDKFSEQIIFYDALKNVFCKVPNKLSGNEILAKYPTFSAEPDYHVKRSLKRGRTNLFIFESKDVLINANVKVSFDYNLYEEELKKKFYVEIKTKPNGSQKKKPKAILQIINNIKRLILKQMPFDQKYHRRKMWIYPILVIHNNQIDVSGVNYVLNEWFQTELNSLRSELGYLGYLVDKVKPLVIVNIDTLLFFQDAFQKVMLEKVIEAYYSFINYPKWLERNKMPISRKTAMQAFEPFSSFCSNYLAERGIRATPKELLYLGKSIFK